MQPPLTLLGIIFFKLLFSTLQNNSVFALAPSICRNACGESTINYPFGVDDGCGAPQFRKMFNCSTDLFFQTPSGNYKVQSIDYEKQTMTIYDPSMSTCSVLQPHHDFVLSDLQSAIIRPSPDTIFILLNCSIDSPVLNHYRDRCLNFSPRTCDEMYNDCPGFKVFHLSSNSSPPCCFTGYDTVKSMSMNILDCSHYASVSDADQMKSFGPLDWQYGIKLSYAVPDSGCEHCSRSGGSCGFDTEMEGELCICSSFMNSTRQCGNTDSSDVLGGMRHTRWLWLTAFVFYFGVFFHFLL